MKPSSTLAKGQIARLRISSLTPGGDGISKEFGIPVFVSRVAPGDVVDVELFDVRKDFARARVAKIIEPSDQREEPFCKLFKVCGGCQWQHLQYGSQLKAKEDIIRQAIQHLGGLDPELVKPVIGAEATFFYRNKVQFPVAHPRDSSRILAGYYQQDSHELVNVKHCPIQPEPLDRMLEAAKQACENYRISAYNEKTQHGILRHINARYSFSTNEMLVTFVINENPEAVPPANKSPSPLKLALQQVAHELMRDVPEVVGVCINFNTSKGNKILGDTTICLVGKEYVEETLKSNRSDLPEMLRCGITFKLSSTSFFQINSAQATKLLETIYDAIHTYGPSKINTIIDAYAGVGTIALWLSPLADKVIALEEHPQAVKDGIVNVEINKVHGIDNVEFRLGQAEETMPELAKAGTVADIVIIDPPRKGLSVETIEALKQLSPSIIIYVSCNPATLARDLRLLAEPALQSSPVRDSIANNVGYTTCEIQPIDLFPQTYHVESVTTLKKVASDGSIRNMAQT